jgi:hypothetical protein
MAMGMDDRLPEKRYRERGVLGFRWRGYGVSAKGADSAVARASRTPQTGEHLDGGSMQWLNGRLEMVDGFTEERYPTISKGRQHN